MHRAPHYTVIALPWANQLHVMAASLQGFDEAAQGHGNAVYFGRVSLGDDGDAQGSRLLEYKSIGRHTRQV